MKRLRYLLYGSVVLGFLCLIPGKVVKEDDEEQWRQCKSGTSEIGIHSIRMKRLWFSEMIYLFDKGWDP